MTEVTVSNTISDEKKTYSLLDWLEGELEDIYLFSHGRIECLEERVQETNKSIARLLQVLYESQSLNEDQLKHIVGHDPSRTDVVFKAAEKTTPYPF